MAGHSKWANIQHRKGRQDAARSKLFSKLSKEITVAARMGDPDPGQEPAAAPRGEGGAGELDAASDNIDRAIKKATGGDAENYEEIRYEGYGPNGVAIIVEAMTDNRNRTASNIRSTFTKRGGNLGETGSVAFMFDRKGQIVYPAGGGLRGRGDDGGDRGRRRGRGERRGRARDLVRRQRPRARSRRRSRRRSARRSTPSWSGGRRPRPRSTSRRRRA